MKVLILGCGYVGRPLGAELVRLGHEVWGVRRSGSADESMRAVGIKPLHADITRAEDLAGLPGPFDWVVNCTASSHGGPEDYQKVYLQGNKNLMEWITANPVKKFVYTSSTSVYGQDDFSQVKESSPTEPLTETGRILVQTEALLMDAAQQKKLPVVVLRVSGIYGPDRGHFFKQYLRNEAKIPGQGERVMNMIHLEDLVGVIIAALKNGRAGEVYNAVDDEPVAQIHFFRWLSETLGKWMPPFATVEETTESKRGVTNKKVQNRKLKMELGYQFKYANFRKGYTAEIKRLDDLGLINIEPEPR